MENDTVKVATMEFSADIAGALTETKIGPTIDAINRAAIIVAQRAKVFLERPMMM